MSNGQGCCPTQLKGCNQYYRYSLGPRDAIHKEHTDNNAGSPFMQAFHCLQLPPRPRE